MGKKTKTKTKTKSNAKRDHRAGKPGRAVRGPQLVAGALTADAAGHVPEGVKEGRTPVAQEHHTGARLRYLEAPRKRRGNPFCAVRVPREMKAHWDGWLKRKNKEHAPAMREAMAKLCGYHGDTEGAPGGRSYCIAPGAHARGDQGDVEATEVAL